MGRPSKNNCEYYPHFTTMRNHRKIKALRNKFGAVLGYAFWSMFIEYLTELDGNEWEFSEIECEMFASELGVSATDIRSLVEYSIQIELLFNKNGFVYSESLNEKLAPVYEKRQREKDKSATKKRREDGTFTKETSIGGVSAADSPQIEVNRSKVKRSKKDVAKKPPSIYQLCLEFWLKEFKVGWVMDGQKGKALKRIIIDLKTIINSSGKEVTDNTVFESFKLICLNLPDFYKDKDLPVISSKLNEIITEIKKYPNGKSARSSAEAYRF